MYHKVPKNSDNRKNCCNYPKIVTVCFYHRILRPGDDQGLHYLLRLSVKKLGPLQYKIFSHQQDTGEVLMPQDLKKAQTYGGKRICFENDEVVEIKRFDPSGRVCCCKHCKL